MNYKETSVYCFYGVLFQLVLYIYSLEFQVFIIFKIVYPRKHTITTVKLDWVNGSEVTNGLKFGSSGDPTNFAGQLSHDRNMHEVSFLLEIL